MNIHTAVSTGTPTAPACLACGHRRAMEHDAAGILTQIMATCHAAQIRGRKALLQMEVPTTLLEQMHLWGVACEDCEEGYDENESSNEPDSQYEA